MPYKNYTPEILKQSASGFLFAAFAYSRRKQAEDGGKKSQNILRVEQEASPI